MAVSSTSPAAVARPFMQDSRHAVSEAADVEKEVLRLKPLLEGACGENQSSHAGIDILVGALRELTELGHLVSRDVLSRTKIGVVVNKLSKQPSADESVRVAARALVDTWKQAHLKRKAGPAGLLPPLASELSRSSSCFSSQSLPEESLPMSAGSQPPAAGATAEGVVEASCDSADGGGLHSALPDKATSTCSSPRDRRHPYRTDVAGPNGDSADGDGPHSALEERRQKLARVRGQLAARRGVAEPVGEEEGTAPAPVAAGEAAPAPRKMVLTELLRQAELGGQRSTGFVDAGSSGSGPTRRERGPGTLSSGPRRREQDLLGEEPGKRGSAHSGGAMRETTKEDMEAEAKADEAMRGKVRLKFLDALGSSSASTTLPIEVCDSDGFTTVVDKLLDPDVLARDMEEALYVQKKHQEGQKAYMDQARSIIFNLKDASNPMFKLRLLAGIFSAERVPRLSATDMASAARNAARAQMRKEAAEERDLDWAKKHGALQVSGTFQCGKCKQWKTTYYQMQTRSSDEPMTTFVTCINCKNRWKFC